MIIYQLHKCGGEWEDYYDYIIGSYLRKERAVEEKEKAERQEAERDKYSKMCADCPYVDIDIDCESYDDLVKKMKSYCDRCDVVYDGDAGWICKNYLSLYDESFFVIKEVEVEE